MKWIEITSEWVIAILCDVNGNWARFFLDASRIQYSQCLFMTIKAIAHILYLYFVLRARNAASKRIHIPKLINKKGDKFQRFNYKRYEFQHQLIEWQLKYIHRFARNKKEYHFTIFRSLWVFYPWESNQNWENVIKYGLFSLLTNNFTYPSMERNIFDFKLALINSKLPKGGLQIFWHLIPCIKSGKNPQHENKTNQRNDKEYEY